MTSSTTRPTAGAPVTLISATTRGLRAQTTGTRSRSAEEFFRSAEVLLEQARAHMDAGDCREALETGYRAALRTAGARCALSPVLAARKRLPSGAWEQLALAGASSAAWAERLGAYSRIRSRVFSGLDATVDRAVVEELLTAVEEFLADTLSQSQPTQEVA